MKTTAQITAIVASYLQGTEEGITQAYDTIFSTPDLRADLEERNLTACEYIEEVLMPLTENNRYKDFAAENTKPDGLRFLPYDHKCYDVAGTNYTVTDLDNELVNEEHRENAIVIRLDEKEIFRGGTWAEVIAKLKELV